VIERESATVRRDERGHERSWWADPGAGPQTAGVPEVVDREMAKGILLKEPVHLFLQANTSA
jgi:hypothetical protein